MNTRFSNPAPPERGARSCLASVVCLLSAILLLPASVCQAAGGGADYGRGPETDPVATAALVAVYSATNALTVRMTAAEGATNALDVAVTALQGATGSLDVAVTALQGATGSLDVAVTALQGATNALDTAKANKADVFGTPVIASEYAAGVLISTNVITLKNGAGDTTTDYAVARVWLATAANAVSHDGTEIQKVTDKQDYWVVVTNAGTVTFVITEAATTTNTLSVSVGPNIDTQSIPLSD